jgi:hypothetical protein
MGPYVLFLVSFVATSIAALPSTANAAEPKLVMSIASGGGTTICDTDCTTCDIPSGECFTAVQQDLIICKPLSSGLPITSCDWEPFFLGSAPGIQLDNQLRALDIAPNGNLVFVSLNDKVLPGIGSLFKIDIGLFQPTDVLAPYISGEPYTDGGYKLYLNGDLTQQDETAKPWDALELLTDASCGAAITLGSNAPHTCPIVGSLTAGSGTAGLGGVHFANEDLLRCIPDGFAANGTVESCQYSLFLDASNINDDQGITSDIEAIDFLSFDPETMTGAMVFKKAGGNPPGFPAHDPVHDLLLYEGTFGAGTCVPSGKLCAGDSDCPGGESCHTGTCSVSATSCATNADCSGSGNTCAVDRYPTATVSLYFDGGAVGLAGAGQKIEGFAIVPDGDGDDVPDGADNCPEISNPPDVCSGGVASCPSGLSSECPGGETCVQADDDGDGVGDPCDQCNGRDDAVCFCGDGIVDVPSEQCDLGGENGMAGSPCDATCHVMGLCTGSGAPCTTAADCPPGQGCCGNDVVEGDEGCDDGNTIEDDTCMTDCTTGPGIPIVGCEDLTGPNVIPGFVKRTQFKNTKALPDFDRWKTKGDFNFPNGLVVDADSQDVTIVFNNGTAGVLLQSTLPPDACGPGSCFVEKKPAPKGKWLFLDKEADVPGSPSWRKGKLKQKENKMKLTLDGRNVTLFDLAGAGSPPAMRETLRIGQACVTATLGCEVKGKGTKLKCASVP